MKKQVRQGVFETNSSSVHAICICTDDFLHIPEKLRFGFGEFGWGETTLNCTQEKADYLWTAIACIDDFDTIKKYTKFIAKTLKEHGVRDIDFEPIEIHIGTWGNDAEVFFSCPDDYWIDHVHETREFVDAVCTDEDRLMNYLFTNRSYIATGNDNSDSCPRIDEVYPHEEYYKSN